MKKNGHHYYSVLLCPCNHVSKGSDHIDVDVFMLPSSGSLDYLQNLMKIVSIPNQT